MPTSHSPIGAYIQVGLIIAVSAALIFLLIPTLRTVRIEDSAFGFDGLARWLAARDIPTRIHARGMVVNPDAIGLRILPLFDDDPGEGALFPQGREARYLNGSVRAIEANAVMRKAETLPTLIVLAKWRDGVRLGGFIHPEFLLPTDPPAGETEPEAEMADAVELPPAIETDDLPGKSEDASPDNDAIGPNRLVGPDTDIAQFRRLAHSGPYGFETVDLGPYGEAQIYAPQYAAAPEGCEALVGTRQRGLLFECQAYGMVYHVLSDPDLLNNHGLMRGDNAEAAIRLVRDLAGEGAVMVDYSVLPSLVLDTARGRELSDLLRYFELPFLWLWIAAAAVLVIVLWRGGIRGVPLLRRFTEGHGAARRTAFTVQAGLMRRARADGALLKALMSAQLATLADRVLGRGGAMPGRRERLLRALRHRDPETAAALEAAIADIDSLSDAAAGETAIAALDRLETAYRQALELT